MRKLGKGQSLVCVVSPEIYRSILQTSGKSEMDPIDISDVIRWTIEQTCRQLDRFKPMSLIKGASHLKRRLAYQSALDECSQDVQDFVGMPELVNRFLELTKEKDAKTLEELYLDQTNAFKVHHSIQESDDPVAVKFMEELSNMEHSRISDDGGFLDEQQERELHKEVMIEVEMEREVEFQRPSKVEAAKPSIHSDVEALVRTGTWPSSTASEAFENAFSVFDTTSVAALLPQMHIMHGLIVTTDFMRTVSLEDNNRDAFVRSVRWVLSCNDPNLLFIISQYEANHLLPSIWKSDKVSLHLYTPRVAKSTPSFYNLQNFVVSGPNTPTPHISPEILTKLHLFAGALYFDSAAQYNQLCDLLGVVGSGRRLPPQIVPENGGFVKKEDRKKVGWRGCDFVKSPIPFVGEVLAMRRKGENFNATHMGKLVRGRILRAEDFE